VSASDYIILEHHLDEERDPAAYTLKIGKLEKIEQPVIDPDTGEYVRMPGAPMTQMVPQFRQDGTPRLSKGEPVFEEEPVLDPETGEQVIAPGDVATELREVVVAEFEYLFAADDDAWRDSTDEDIANRQAARVLRVLRKQEKEQEELAAAAANRAPLPTVGKKLNEL
jgi:hypothetical protein